MIYTEHSLAKKLKDSPITDYNPKWTKNVSKIENRKKIVTEKVENKKTKLSWDTF